MIFLALGLLLLTARMLGELARRFNQPAVLGELITGIVLGPTVLGHLAPGAEHALFPTSGTQADMFRGVTQLGVVLFLLVVGMEVNLSAIFRQGRATLAVSLAGMLAPFAAGYALALAAPAMLGMHAGIDHQVFALFIGTAMSISALPVIAKTLMDINLFRSDLGMIVISSAICNDLVGWISFAVILGLAGLHAGGNDHRVGDSVGATIGLTLLYIAVALTAGRWVLHRILPWIHAHLSWPGGVLSITLALALLGAALMDYIGISALFGSFLVGVALGDSYHLRERTRAVLEQFISFFFAPLFFASIGLRVDFYLNFDLVVVASVLLIACAGKILGCTAGARWSGMPARESWAVGMAMNSRGSMEIILGTMALGAGIIQERTFVALVVMALVTSMLAGPSILRILRRKRVRRFSDHLTPRGFALALKAGTSAEAIGELAALAAPMAGGDAATVAAAVLAREAGMPTGLGNHLAVPHARLPGLAGPVVAVGLSRAGIPFGSPDGEPAHIVVMLLTAIDDDGAQLELLADVAATFKSIEARAQAESVGSYTEFLALVRTLHGIEPPRAEGDARHATAALTK
jgi:Kef-type K+ transport system membrane component KefB/mannitol/fructose-specific phosphotransferase system IIA component (Ntr-type)